jgi:hypothetical protein
LPTGFYLVQASLSLTFFYLLVLQAFWKKTCPFILRYYFANGWKAGKNPPKTFGTKQKIARAHEKNDDGW